MNGIGDEHPAGIGQSFDPGRDVYAVAIEVVALDDHVAQIDADAQFDALLRLDTGAPLGHRLLHRDGAAHRVDDARKFDQPVVLTMRPWCSAIFGSRSSRRSAVRCSSVPSSSAPISRE